MLDMKKMLALYFVCGTQDCRHLGENAAENLLKVLEAALQGGITCFQFRDKGKDSLAADPIAQRQLAQQCRDLCRVYQVPFIVNDDLELALAVAADGIHVGQGDLAVQRIRAQTDKPLIIGLSVNDLEQAKAADALAEVDYLGVGPIFPTQSKADLTPVLGMEFVGLLREQGIGKPLVAIGGIKRAHIPRLLQYGADGVAVITAISHAADVASAARSLLREVEVAR